MNHDSLPQTTRLNVTPEPVLQWTDRRRPSTPFRVGRRGRGPPSIMSSNSRSAAPSPVAFPHSPTACAWVPREAMAGSCANGRPPSSCRSSHCDGRSRASGGRPDRPCTLVDLPRGAVSGPVQEDKAEAHAVLKRLVRVSHSTLESVDLKTIEGVCSREILVQAPCPRLEDLATAEVCRGVRIISYKDFVKALSLACRVSPTATASACARPPGTASACSGRANARPAPSPRRSSTPAAANWN